MIIEYYDSLEELSLYNWDRYTSTKDHNWFIIGYNGRQTKVNNETLEHLEIKFKDDYFKLINDRTFSNKLQKWAKIEWLTTKFNLITTLVNRMWMGFADFQMDMRANYINMINQYGFKMPLINSTEGDAEELLKINNAIQNIKTQIKILQDELKEDGKQETASLNKQLIIIGMGLGLNYKLNPKEISVSEWVEFCKLLEEKSKKN